MSVEGYSNCDDAVNSLTLKYETIEDYMNNTPLSDVDVEFDFNIQEAELVFNKPIFDMAFIITHNSLISKISVLEKHFQCNYAFTTHCIFLPELSKLKFCIRDLKLHQITYAIVIYENSLMQNSMDLYILYPIIEVQKKMSLMEMDELVKADSDNFTLQIQALKKIPVKNPHPINKDSKELFNMNDEFRYHLCLLSDNRMLSLEELEKLNMYLKQRKYQMEKAMNINNNLLEERPLEACRQERLKYYIYEPINDIDKPIYAQSSSTKNSDASRPPIKFNVATNKNNIPSVYQLPIKYTSHSVYENPIIHKAKIVNCEFNFNPPQIKGVQITRGQLIPLSYEILQGGILKPQITKRNDSHNIEYSKSDYFLKNTNLYSENKEDDVISLSSGTCTPPIEYDLISITPPSPHLSPVKVELGKRKSETIFDMENNSIPKLCTINMSNSSIKNSPDALLNLFRLILNIIPIELPHDNVLLNIISSYCNDVQNGIMEPSLKIVKIDYESCKTNGANEIIKSIYGIYEVSEKNIEDLSDIQYVWKKYFPDHLSNFSLLIVFYRFVKMLIIFRLFNTQLDRLNIVINAIEKINMIVNFDFQLPILSDKEHLNFVSELFNKNYVEHDELHAKYFDLPHLSVIPLANKKLDSVMKQKKIEFTLNPLLTYFVNSINSIHQQMKLYQTKIIYSAIRTLRFCLREIYPINSPTTVFNAPKTFSEAQNNGFKDVIEETKWLLDELKYYQCVLFTEKHYDFINCVLDFSFMIEGALTIDSETFVSKTSNDSLIILDPVQFIESFASFDGMVLQYHPEAEISFLKSALKDCWVHILQKAFRGISTDGKGRRIIKEMNNFLPALWGLRTFDEAVTEAAKINYTDWTKIAQADPSGWYETFSKVKFSGIVWLNTNQLPLTKAVEELQKYENMLKNEFLCPSA